MWQHLVEFMDQVGITVVFFMLLFDGAVSLYRLWSDSEQEEQIDEIEDKVDELMSR